MKRYIICAALCFAGSAMADARLSTVQPTPARSFGLVYAQAQLNDLSESDLRRLVFYADRATQTLRNLVEGSQNRSIGEQDKVNKRFRESISRLATAGARSGLSMDQVADFYTQDVVNTLGQSFMQQLGELAGGLDFRTLFRNVATVTTPPTAQNADGAGLLDALEAASRDLQLDTPFSGQPRANASSAVPLPQNDGPVALENASDAERAIIDRVRVNDGRWELTVIAGDSLSTIASAIYGDALSYTLIYSANTDVLRSANVIDVGTVLVLPRP